MIVLAGFVLAAFLYGLASASLERTVLTAPILFTAEGAGMAPLQRRQSCSANFAARPFAVQVFRKRSFER